MFKTIMTCALLALTAHAHAGITTINIGGGTVVFGENWPQGDTWHVRAILTDSSLQPIGSLSTETTYSTASLGSVPTNVTVTLDAAAPAGAVVLVYRSINPIVAGDTVERAEYTGLCPLPGCAAGSLIVPATGQLLNSDFQPDNRALPVKLQDFSVD
jgi:hypothetical protein